MKICSKCNRELKEGYEWLDSPSFNSFNFLVCDECIIKETMANIKKDKTTMTNSYWMVRSMPKNHPPRRCSECRKVIRINSLSGLCSDCINRYYIGLKYGTGAKHLYTLSSLNKDDKKENNENITTGM